MQQNFRFLHLMKNNYDESCFKPQFLVSALPSLVQNQKKRFDKNINSMISVDITSIFLFISLRPLASRVVWVVYRHLRCHGKLFATGGLKLNQTITVLTVHE